MKTLPVAALLAALLLAPAAGAQTTLKVRPQPGVNNTTVEIPLEKYVAAVLAGEGSVLRSDEALKALAVAARTFGVYGRGRHRAEGYDLCGTTHCQRLDLAGITPRLERAAAATAGELLWFAGKPAFAVYSRDCGGATEDVAAVWPAVVAPYLRRQTDPYCLRAGVLPWEWLAKPADLLAALNAAQLRAPRRVERIEISGRTASGRVRELALDGGGERVRIGAGAFRFAVGRALGWNTVRSDQYQVEGLEFRGTGSGHGVGLCQRGADRMGAEGRPYGEILAFYYPGTLLGLTGRGLHWTRLGGESIALFTTRPGRDGAVLALAERELRELSQNTSLPAPRGLEIRLYPDVETFRDATGEPGWVAAHTAGARIQLQPAGAARGTLRHELLHVLVESRATAGLPVWFREGLVGYLEEPTRVRARAMPPADADLRQTADPQLARRAYGQAAASVAGLVERYGEATVLSWLAAGLPREVRNASSSAAPTKSK
jgi:stage II sporulation protein D